VMGSVVRRRRGVERYIPPPPAYKTRKGIHEWIDPYVPYVPFLLAPYTHEGYWGWEERSKHFETDVDERIRRLSVWVVFPFIEWNIVDGSYMIRHVAAVRPW